MTFFRVGIVPYTWINGILHIGLGLDSRYKEITDFGGKCDFCDQTLLSTAIREYVEETNAPIDFDFESQIELKSGHHVMYIMRTMPYIMSNYIQYISNREMIKGLVIKWSDFQRLVDGGTVQGYKLWDSLADLLRPEMARILESITQYAIEPIPILPDVVTVEKTEVFKACSMFPTYICESNVRYTISEQGCVVVSKEAFLDSKFTRPHFREALPYTPS